MQKYVLPLCDRVGNHFRQGKATLFVGAALCQPLLRVLYFCHAFTSSLEMDLAKTLKKRSFSQGTHAHHQGISLTFQNGFTWWNELIGFDGRPTETWTNLVSHGCSDFRPHDHLRDVWKKVTMHLFKKQWKINYSNLWVISCQIRSWGKVVCIIFRKYQTS